MRAGNLVCQCTWAEIVIDPRGRAKKYFSLVASYFEVKILLLPVHCNGQTNLNHEITRNQDFIRVSSWFQSLMYSLTQMRRARVFLRRLRYLLAASMVAFAFISVGAQQPLRWGAD